jgi:2-haloacid dehalogenase
VADRWATFDCYGTLIDWNGGISAVLHRLWPHLPVDRLLREYHALEPIVEAGRGLPYREVGARVLGTLAAVEAVPLAAADHYALADALPTWPVFAEVPSALADLRARGWRLAILSNSDPDLLATSVQKLGVPIDETVTAADAGSYKPAHGHWRVFVERTGAAPSHHVHVAASAFHDLQACAELGLTAVWINRLAEVSALPRAAELTELADLPATLDRLVAAS